MNLPASVKQGRDRLCKACPTPCQHPQTAEAGAACAIGRWPAYTRVGLGDAVAKVLSPNGVLCPGCTRRKGGLNRLVPDIKHLLAR